MSGGGENAQFGATAAMVAAATTAAMQDSQPFSQMQNNMTMGNPQYSAMNGYGQQRSHNPAMTGMGMGGNGGMNGMTGMGQMGNAMNGMNPMAQMANMGMHANMMSSQMGPGQMGGSAKMGPGYQRRHTPYPSGTMLMGSRKTQYMGAQPSFGPGPGQYPTGYGGRPSFQSQYPPQQPLGPSGNFNTGMRTTMRQSTPPYSNQGQYFNSAVPNQFPQHQAGNGQYGSQYGGQFAQEVAMRSNMSYQHSPVPGNPTPPLTPASSMPPYISPNADVKPHFNELKPPIGMQNDELRLTFPVRDGIILPPFRLEHNLAVSNHVFQLKPTVHSTLIWRSDLELQLKCFHHEDRQMNTNWPASVQVSVNATPLIIDRGENKTSHKPLYLKEVCQPGRNTIQITVSACCCSHLFVLQLVHRPSVRSVLQGLLRKRLLTADHCIAKIKMNFNQTPVNPNNGSNPTSDRDSVEQTALKVSLKCPITFKKITLPARGHECKHIQCFDLESYLQLNCERGSWRCPVCNKPAQLEGLEVDQYMWGILNTLNTSDVDEVTIDSGANWKATKINTNAGIKQEDDSNDTPGKRSKAVSPGSMNMPTMNNWDMNQALSPYLPPDMNTIASGSMISSYNQGGQNRNSGSSNQNYDFGMSNGPGSNEYAGNGPLSHLNESVNSLDPLNAMEKSLNEQMPHTPHTPHTPGSAHTPGGGGGAHTPGSSHTPGPPSVDHHPLTDVDIPADLNFDPAAVIDGEGTDNLNLLPETSVDPMELLSYLDAPALGELLATPPSSSSSAGSHPPRAPSSDDLLALFE
ncbi:zinc finger MIZ domain-containing protein 1 [Vanessa atalanta]|uniref:zinc finger MIZ domain-containing protein 1 n=1 Tax=Vanessa cardui TaxID=171605 RepID=UPI001F12DD4C|nr:zinc finger MIZ domain-containing protein 1 [Vanessa cardui]XP_047528527.1 zinc finger MIZ domain-containing protein 1 [Vanessa atalanta]